MGDVLQLLQFHITYFKIKSYDANIILEKFHKWILTAKFEVKRSCKTKFSLEVILCGPSISYDHIFPIS